jgi:Secretion system C-terminal sorting domain/Periplasmic copper-binding protein (NosD)
MKNLVITILVLLSVSHVKAQLSGTYYIGSCGTADFATFSDAASALSGGVTAPVTLKVCNQTFTEQVTLPVITGTDATNTVTFEPDAGTPILQFAPTSSSANFVLRFNGADFVIMKGITIRNTALELAPASGTLGGVVFFVNNTGGSDDITFDGMTLEGINGTLSSVTPGAAAHAGVLVMPSNTVSTQNNDRFTLTNSTIRYGSWGVFIDAHDTAHAVGTTVTNNTFTGSNYSASTIEDHNNVTFSRNNVSNPSAGSGSPAVYLNDCDGPIRVERNKILRLTATKSGYALYINNAAGTAGSEGVIANNMIRVSDAGSGAISGLHLFSSAYQKVYYNSVSMDVSTTSGSYGAFYASSVTNSDVKNNIFGTNKGYAYNLSTGTGFTSNYNNFFATGTGSAGYSGFGVRASVAAFSANTGTDANSVSAPPTYNGEAAADLTLSSGMTCAGLGVAVAEVTVDYSNSTRTAYVMGAHELSLSAPNVTYTGAEMIPATVGTLTVNAPLTLAAPLTVCNALVLNAALTNDVTNNATISNLGSLTRNAGSIAVAPTYTTVQNITYGGSTGVTVGAEFPATGATNVVINNSAGVTLAANIAVSGGLSVLNGARLNTDAYIVTGAGAFTANAGSTLATKHTQGFSNTASTGAIQVTGTKTFRITSADSPFISLIYDGTTAQVTGNVGVSSSHYLQNLTINNAAGVQLTNSANTTYIHGALNMNSGTFNFKNSSCAFSGSIIMQTGSSGNLDGTANLNGCQWVLDSAVFTGAGTVDVSAASSIITTKHASGLNGNFPSASITGNNGTFRFNGSTTQVTGTKMPTTIAGIRPNNSAGTTLSQATLLTGASGLDLFNNLTTSLTNLLTLDTTVNLTQGFYPGATIVGPLARKTNSIGTYQFPLGLSTNKYIPAAISTTTADPTTFLIAYYGTASANATGAKGSGIVQVSNKEYFDVQRTAGISDATVTLAWPDAIASGIGSVGGLTPPGNLSDLRVLHWTGTQWENMGNAATTGTASSTNSGSIKATTVSTSFSPFTLGSISSQNALPITLTAATAQIKENQAEITWTVASEQNTQAYEIEHLQNGTWKSVANVAVNAERNYAFTSNKLKAGINQFRIVELEKEGTKNVIKELSVLAEVPEGAVLYAAYPNPFSNEASIEFAVAESQNVKVNVYNALGQQVATLFEGNVSANELQKVQITAENLPSGIYFVRLNTQNVVSSQRIVIVR